MKAKSILITLITLFFLVGGPGCEEVPLIITAVKL